MSDVLEDLLDRRLLIVTGKGGTGKTTTVVKILAALARQPRMPDTGPAPRVLLLAPTGKAGMIPIASRRDRVTGAKITS